MAVWGKTQHVPPEDQEQLSAEQALVEGWRIRELIRAGVPFEDAEMLACVPDVAHRAAVLLERGCPPGLVARILG